MREIKFRGRKSNGEWIYGDLVTIEKTDGHPSRKEILPFDAVLFEDTEEVEKIPSVSSRDCAIRTARRFMREI